MLANGGVDIVMVGFGSAAAVWWASWVIQLAYIGFLKLLAPRGGGPL